MKQTHATNQQKDNHEVVTKGFLRQELRRELDQVHDRIITEISAVITDALQLISNRFDKVDQRFQAVDRRFDQVDERLEHLEQSSEEYKLQFNRMIKELRRRSEQGDNHEVRIRRLEKRTYLAK